MKLVKETVKLKNMYSGDVVLCDNLDHVEQDDGINFIKVYEEQKPDRKYWVNKESFRVLQG